MTKPYPFQRETVDYIDQMGGCALIGHEMGLGKTLCSLLWAQRHEKIRPIIVICPAVVKDQWQLEALNHIQMRSEILFGRKPPRHNNQLARAPMLIINYDILRYWLKYLIRLKPKLVIIDECQLCKHPTTFWSKCIKKLCQRVPNVIALSGTPMENEAIEMWHILSILQPLRPEFQSYRKFAFRWSNAKRTPWGWRFKGSKNPQKLHRLITGDRGPMIRRLKENVLTQLPPKSRIVIPTALVNPKEYEMAERDFRGWLTATKPAAARRASRKGWKAEQFVKLGYLKRLAARLKLPSIYQWIDTFLTGTDEKLLVFAIHTNIISALKERYEDRCVTLTGSTSPKQRTIAKEKFANDKHTRLLFGNLQAAGKGWNCKSTSTVLTVELGWKPAEHNQADERIYGINRGNGKPAMCYYLVAKETLEVKLCKLLQDKQETGDAILDGIGKGQKQTKDIFDLLCDELEKDKTRSNK